MDHCAGPYRQIRPVLAYFGMTGVAPDQTKLHSGVHNSDDATAVAAAYFQYWRGLGSGPSLVSA
jgi:hypothetical protein